MYRQSSVHEVAQVLGITSETVKMAVNSGLFPVTRYEDDDNPYLDPIECSWAWIHYLGYMSTHAPITESSMSDAVQNVISLRLQTVAEGSYFDGIEKLRAIADHNDDLWIDRWMPEILVTGFLILTVIIFFILK